MLTGLGVLAAVILLLIATLGEHEPIFEGKPIFRWLAQLHSADPALTNQTIRVLNRTIIPQLTWRMVTDTNDSRIRLTLIDYLNTLPNVNIFYRTAGSRRADAACLIGSFGPCAKRAVPALLDALQGSDLAVRAAAAEALGDIHSEPGTVIPVLIRCLDDKYVDEAAALALAEYGSAAKAAIPKLLELSKVPEKDLHRAVTIALSKINPALPEAASSQ